MTSIEQLAINGIRAFNPETSARQTIRFRKPLTIILGPNGCGKTTVIEALRNACTGELPANTGKGSAFIHDPKIAGETDVKGQVRLQFRTSAGQQMLVGRSYQLTQLAGGKQRFETLDASLQRRDPQTGEMLSQSFKCSDIDRLVPELMGISKPILDNVIFLHQDDTNWPLQEAAKLKKKFDDIFSSTRYTKALEELRKVSKENKEKIKEHLANLAVFKEKRQVAHQLRAQVEETRAKMQRTEAQLASLDEQVAKLSARVEETQGQADEIQQLESGAIQLQGQVDALVHQREAMGQALRVVSDDSDEKLEEALRSYDSFYDAAQREIADAAAKAEALGAECEELTTKHHSLNGEREFIMRQRGEHEGRVRQMRRRVQQLAEEHAIELQLGAGGELGEDALLRFSERFRVEADALRAARAKAQQEARWAEDEADRQLGAAKQQLDANATALRFAEQRCEALRPALRHLKDRHTVLEAAESELAGGERLLRQLEEAAAGHRQEEEALAREVAELQRSQAALEEQANALHEEATARQQEQQAVHKLRLLRDEREKLLQKEAATKDEVNRRFQAMTGQLPKSIHDVRQAAENKSGAVARARGLVVKAEKASAVAAQAAGDMARRQAELAAEAERCEQSYRPVVEKHQRPLPELLEKAEAKAEKERKTVAMMQALQTCHDRFVEQAEEEGGCPICSRGMAEADLSVMQKHLRMKLQDIPAKVAEKKESLDRTQRFVRDVRALLPFHRDAQRLRAEAEELRGAQAEKAAAAEAEAAAAADLQAKAAALEEEERELAALLATAEAGEETRRSLREVDEGIRAEERRIAAQYGEGVRPLDLVEKEIEQLRGRMQDIGRQQQQVLRRSHDAADRRQGAQQQIQRQMQCVAESRAAVEERRRVGREYEAQHAEFLACSNDAAERKTRSAALEQQVAELEKKRWRVREDGDAACKELEEKAHRAHRDLSDIDACTADIKKFADGAGRPAHLEALSRALQEVDERKQQAEYQREREQARKAAAERKLAARDENRRNLEANVAYRKMCREVAKGEQQLLRMRQVVSERAQGHEGVWQTLDKLKADRSALEAERARFAGQQQVNDALLKERLAELQSTKYDRIDERYNSTQIRLVTTQIAEEDVQKYASALDLALMRYHDEKISEVNELIRDLWIRTYRGSDIDYIELRSSVESSVTTSRNYNYRVVMVKGGVALDMRGRCSAGQKVLASLVVRLALSQAFCCDCGILALDEPTTNLDVDNIDSLAYALTEIIAERRGQQNFQLIVITHDEQFVRRIGDACGADSVYHLSKSANGQYSTITERRLSEFI